MKQFCGNCKSKPPKSTSCLRYTNKPVITFLERLRQLQKNRRRQKIHLPRKDAVSSRSWVLCTHGGLIDWAANVSSLVEWSMSVNESWAWCLSTFWNMSEAHSCSDAMQEGCFSFSCWAEVWGGKGHWSKNRLDQIWLSAWIYCMLSIVSYTISY